MELGYIGEPEHVRAFGVEIALDEVRHLGADITLVRAVFPAAFSEHNHAILRHDATHHLFRYDDAFVAEVTMDTTVSRCC